MTTLGVVFRPEVAPERLRDVAVAADEAGLEELWLWEDCFKEGGLTTAAAALAWTARLRLGIGLLPMPLRNVAITAMELATLERMFPGRLLPGVGHGVLDWMGQVGARVDSPLTLMREYVPALRSLLAGTEVTVQGRYVSLDRVRLNWPPAVRPPLLVGAEGPKTLRLAGEVGDGAILTGGTTPDGVRRAVDIIAEGRDATGRQDGGPVVVYLIAATGPGAQARLEAELQRWKFPSSGDTGIAGDARTIAAGIARWADAGATSVILQPTEDEPNLERFVEFVAKDLRPLVP